MKKSRKEIIKTFYRHFLTISVILLVFSFPSICFSELTTVEGEDCEIYPGDMNNKKELDEFRKSVREYSIGDGLEKLDGKDKGSYIYPDCVRNIISNYLERVVVVSHTEEGRKICEKVEITLDPEVINEYLSQNDCEYYPSQDDF